MVFISPKQQCQKLGRNRKTHSPAVSFNYLLLFYYFCRESARLCMQTAIPLWQICQWRSEALRGPGSTVTWGPFLSLPSTSPPSPPPFPPLSQPSPSPCRETALQIQLGGLGERCKLPSGVWGGALPKSTLVNFSLKIRHLVATILMIFLRVLPKIFLWPHYSGAPGARSPGSLNRLNPRFLRH